MFVDDGKIIALAVFALIELDGIARRDLVRGKRGSRVKDHILPEHFLDEEGRFRFVFVARRVFRIHDDLVFADGLRRKGIRAVRFRKVLFNVAFRQVNPYALFGDVA